MKQVHARAVAFVLSALCTGGCGSQADELRPHESARLPKGVVARVDSREVTAQEVEHVLAGSGVTAKEAVERTVRDALFARLASERADLVNVAERAVLGRALRESLLGAARDAGPLTDAELSGLTEANWLELARPPAVRVVHAVALVKAPEQKERAREVAAKIAASVKGKTEAQAFAQAAYEASKEDKDIEVRIEPLPPMDAEGRTVPVDELDRGGSGAFDPAFAKSANQLDEAGQISPVVESPFGFHVLLAVEVLPEKRVDADVRRQVLDVRAMAARAEPGRVELVEKLRQSTPVEVARNFDQLTLQAWTPR